MAPPDGAEKAAGGGRAAGAGRAVDAGPPGLSSYVSAHGALPLSPLELSTKLFG